MERIVKKLAKKQRLVASILLGLQLPGCLAMAAPAEPWVYDSLGELAAAGYLEMPEKPLDSYSREELAEMVSKALAEVVIYPFGKPMTVHIFTGSRPSAATSSIYVLDGRT